MVSVFGLFLFYNCLSLQYQAAFALTKVPIDCHLTCKLRENFKKRCVCVCVCVGGDGNLPK